MDRPSVHTAITRNASTPYLTNFSARSAFGGICSGFLRILEEIHAIRSPIAPKLQRYPQKNLPQITVTGKTAASTTS